MYQIVKTLISGLFSLKSHKYFILTLLYNFTYIFFNSIVLLKESYYNDVEVKKWQEKETVSKWEQWKC